MPKAMIGPFQFRYIIGVGGPNIPLTTPKVLSFSRAGYAGVGFQRDAWRGDPIDVQGLVGFITPTSRSLGAVSAAQLEGMGLLAYYDNNGELFPYIKVSRLSCATRDVINDTNGENYHLIVNMTLTSAATGY